jgi:hypothetical protein
VNCVKSALKGNSDGTCFEGKTDKCRRCAKNRNACNDLPSIAVRAVKEFMVVKATLDSRSPQTKTARDQVRWALSEADEAENQGLVWVAVPKSEVCGSGDTVSVAEMKASYDEMKAGMKKLARLVGRKL